MRSALARSRWLIGMIDAALVPASRLAERASGPARPPPCAPWSLCAAWPRRNQPARRPRACSAACARPAAATTGEVGASTSCEPCRACRAASAREPCGDIVLIEICTPSPSRSRELSLRTTPSTEAVSHRSVATIPPGGAASGGLFQDQLVERKIRRRPAQSRVLRLQVLQPLDLIRLQTTKLLPAAVVGHLGHSDRADRVGYASTELGS